MESGARYYRPELDALRFVAFLLVFLYHALPDGSDPRVVKFPVAALSILDAVNKACSFGLTLFFALSAFLIAELLTREKQQAGTIKVGAFYVRRILRIWPLYFAAIGLGLIFCFVPGGKLSELSAVPWFAAFLGSWWIVLHGTPLANPMNPLWSISVEEQFYLVIPWFIKKLSRKAMIIAGLLIILASNLWLAHIANMSHSDARLWFDPFVNFQVFAGGILLSLILKGSTPNFSLRSRLAIIGAGAASWMLATYGFHVRFHALPFPGVGHVIFGYQAALIGTLLILLGTLGVKASLVPGWAIYLGRISFGLYVFHDFFLFLSEQFTIGHLITLGIRSYPLRIVLSGGIDSLLPLLFTIATASLSYRFFESKFLKLKKRYTVIQNQPIPDEAKA